MSEDPLDMNPRHRLAGVPARTREWQQPYRQPGPAGAGPARAAGYVPGRWVPAASRLGVLLRRLTARLSVTVDAPLRSDVRSVGIRVALGDEISDRRRATPQSSHRFRARQDGARPPRAGPQGSGREGVCRLSQHLLDGGVALSVLWPRSADRSIPAVE